MLGLLILPMLLGAAFFMDSGDDEPNRDIEEYSEDEGDLIQFEDFHTRYTGTESGVEIQANDADNVIYAEGGNDTVVALGGDDWVEGGAGDDVLYGNNGEDSVFGGIGDDSIFLGNGDDGTGWITGNGPSDMAGDDFIRGGGGDDVIADRFGSNRLLGDFGNDSVYALDGHSAADANVNEADYGTTDTLEGGDGNDLLFGDDGDVMTGGTGNDEFAVVTDITRAQAVAQIADFDVEDDVLTLYSNAQTAEDIIFEFDEARTGVVASIAGEEIALMQGLTAADIPNITSSFFYDVPDSTGDYTETDGDIVDLEDSQLSYVGTDAGVEFQANDLANTIDAAGGNDTVVALDGADLIKGNDGDDVLYGNDGNDTVMGGAGDDRIFLGAGNDSSGASETGDPSEMFGDDEVHGGAGDDLIDDNFGNNVLFGDQGDDVLNAKDGHIEVGQSVSVAEYGSTDTLSGGAGNDTLIGDDGDIMTGGDGNDEFAVARDFAREQVAAQIVDFNVAEDALKIVGMASSTSSIVYTFDSAQGGVVASVGGEEVAVLQGLVVADIPAITATFVEG